MRTHCTQVDTARHEQLNERAAGKASWKHQSGQQRRKLGLSADYDHWTTAPGITCHGIPANALRFHDSLDIGWGATVKKPENKDKGTLELRKGLWNNLGQDIARITYGKPGTLTSTCLWFSYEKDVALDGVDHMFGGGRGVYMCAWCVDLYNMS